MSVADAAARVSEQPDESSSADPDREPPRPDHAELPSGPEEIDQEPTSLLGRLQQPLEGSIKEDRVGELWDRENGGLNRLALVAEETAGLGDGLPRAVHLVIGLAEAYLNLAEHADAPESSSHQEGSEQPDETSSEHQKVMNYEPGQ